jgi:DNA helicase II / ATP-dependent DNA helicase PcrA
MTTEHQHVTKLFGPPGTGKTTSLVSMIEKELVAGTDPKRVALFTFTRSSAQEARGRVQQHLGLSDGDTQLYRTIHSTAFATTGASRDQMITDKHMQELGNALRVDFHLGKPMDLEDTPLISTDEFKGNQMLAMHHLARVRRVPYREVYRAAEDVDIGWFEFDRFCRTYHDYKQDTGMLDFTDLLETYLDVGRPLDLDVAYIDEAQDLSALQWDVVHKMTAKAKRVVVAGDDDQAIYHWNGADVDRLINLKADTTVVLNQSYRLPQLVADYAKQQTHYIKNRQPKEWSARPVRGVVAYHSDLDSIDMSTGSWLILFRANYMIRESEQQVRDLGVVYTVHGRSVAEPGQAAVFWERLRKGSSILLREAKVVVKYIQAAKDLKTWLNRTDHQEITAGDFIQHGVTVAPTWFDALTRMTVDQREWVRSVVRHSGGRPFFEPARIDLTTIHASKGRQADHVVLFTGMPRKVLDAAEREPDHERRTWYVGLTRARESLHLIDPGIGNLFIK